MKKITVKEIAHLAQKLKKEDGGKKKWTEYIKQASKELKKP